MRDLRDPTALGAWLLSQRKPGTSQGYGNHVGLAYVYDDAHPYPPIPDYDGTNDIRPRVESGAAH